MHFSILFTWFSQYLLHYPCGRIAFVFPFFNAYQHTVAISSTAQVFFEYEYICIHTVISRNYKSKVFVQLHSTYKSYFVALQYFSNFTLHFLPIAKSRKYIYFHQITVKCFVQKIRCYKYIVFQIIYHHIAIATRIDVQRTHIIMLHLYGTVFTAVSFYDLLLFFQFCQSFYERIAFSSICYLQFSSYLFIIEAFIRVLIKHSKDSFSKFVLVVLGCCFIFL